MPAPGEEQTHEGGKADKQAGAGGGSRLIHSSTYGTSTTAKKYHTIFPAEGSRKKTPVRFISGARLGQEKKTIARRAQKKRKPSLRALFRASVQRQKTAKPQNDKASSLTLDQLQEHGEKRSRDFWTVQRPPKPKNQNHLFMRRAVIEIYLDLSSKRGKISENPLIIRTEPTS